MLGWGIQGGTMALEERGVKGSWSLIDNGAWLTRGLMKLGRGVRTDDRSPLVKYYRTSFSWINPSFPGITRWMVTCGWIMICPSEPFTIEPITLVLLSHIPAPWAHTTDGLGSHSDCWTLFPLLQTVSMLFCFSFFVIDCLVCKVMLRNFLHSLWHKGHM